ncbi:response regulator [Shewanella sp. NFH-SH190041]|uniref:response regulator n=1 Tax=Shewanella sp. NFH-SH190041 TaxID=2950245 RepID=UPI0021C3DE49|nr:response regulator [Shewanella sp. NFH-SH190041]BDM65203.1 response regulator [Shewanella sp. NFH-SH190041]
MALIGTSILVVEDDPIFRALLVNFLRQRGAEVFFAANGLQGIQVFTQCCVDIVVADLSMPYLDGLGMLQEIKVIKPETPAVVISGNDNMADVVSSLQLGASDFLVKPVKDLFEVERAIKQGILSQKTTDSSFDYGQLAKEELLETLAVIDKSPDIAKGIQLQLYPQNNLRINNTVLSYKLSYDFEISDFSFDYLQLDDDNILIYIAKFSPKNNQVPIVSLIIKSAINDYCTRFYGYNKTPIDRLNEIKSYIDEIVLNSEMDFAVEILVTIINLREKKLNSLSSSNKINLYITSKNNISIVNKNSGFDRMLPQKSFSTEKSLVNEDIWVEAKDIYLFSGVDVNNLVNRFDEKSKNHSSSSEIIIKLERL